jgi:uncharacterized protein YecE (DUF72 family)
VVGFVDGEGCFSIGFAKQPDRANRRGYRTGLQVMHRFVVTQGERSKASLEELHEFFGVGRLYLNRRHDNHKEHLWQFRVQRTKDLIETIIPFFQQFPLLTAKREDFEKFTASLAIVAQGRHLSTAGMLEIVDLAEQMNHHKARPDPIRILRDHTPNTPRG